jgi:hypothetical protein
MDLDKLTLRSRQAVADAQRLASARHPQAP